MGGHDYCNKFTCDEHYYIAFRNVGSKEENLACACFMKKYAGFKNKILQKLNLKGNNEEQKDIEDSFFEAMAVLLQEIRKGKFQLGRAAMGTFFFVICYRIMMRKKSRNLTEPFTENDTGINITDFNDAELKELENIRSKNAELIPKAILELKGNCSNDLYQNLITKIPNELLAVQRNVSLLAMRNQISRCKERLRNLLIEKYNFGEDGIWL